MKREILYVDGYNMIGAWPNLKRLQQRDEIGTARDELLHELSNYGAFAGVEVIVVFDAQLVPGITQRYEQYDLEVIFTQEGETADEYIERSVGEENFLVSNVKVATSDLAEQWMIFQRGATRKSANELWKDIKQTKQSITSEATAYRFSQYRRNSPITDEDQYRLRKLYHQMVNQKTGEKE